MKIKRQKSSKKSHWNILHVMEAIYGVLTPTRHSRIKQSQRAYKTFVARARAQRTFIQRLADFITRWSGSITFVTVHILWFAAWLAINLGYVPAIPVFDPFPFGLLTLVVSLEAIFLAIFVLLSQNREQQVTNLREEVDFQITTQSEQEITRLINMVEGLQKHLGMKARHDKEFEGMKKNIDTRQIEREVRRES